MKISKGVSDVNILVVDDQPDVVKGIISGVNWEKIGIKNVYGAESAKQAKEILSQKNIDILLTDIEMPHENGIQLIEYVKSNYKSIQCIFLTAHAHFGYAQKAIQLGVISYLLQPASYEDIEKEIQKTKNFILQEHLKKSAIINSQSYANKKLAYLCRNYLKDYILDIEDDINITIDRLNKYGFSMDIDSKILVFLIQVNLWEENKWENDLFLYGIQNIIDEIMIDYCKNSIVVNVENNIYCTVVKLKSNPSIDIIAKDIKNLQDIFHSYLKIDVSIAYDNIVEFDKLVKKHNELKSVLSNSIDNSNKIIFYKQSEVIYNCDEQFTKWKMLLEQDNKNDTVKKEILEH